MKIWHTALWTVLFAVAGYGLAIGWQGVVVGAFESSGAQVLIAAPSALLIEQAWIAVVTGLIVPLAEAIRAIAGRVAGRSIWPGWVLWVAMAMGENLSMGLRMVALATIDLPRQIAAAADGAAPVLDLRTVSLDAWATAGVVGAAAISLGILIAFGLISPEESAREPADS
ncbi:MAG: hypothetical protein AAFV53_05060 [Myxococcota bacterium]